MESVAGFIWNMQAYMDVLNYTMSIVDQKCERNIEKILNIFKETDINSLPKGSERQLVKALSSILEFVFFIYSVSPRVNTTIRLCRILRLVIYFLKSITITHGQKQLIYKQISDDICLILRKYRSEEQTQVETLYLLIALFELGKDYRLEEIILAEYLGVSLDIDINLKQNVSSLNYFSITVALFYMRDYGRYNNLRSHIVKGSFGENQQKTGDMHQ